MTAPAQGSLVEFDVNDIAHGGEGVGRVAGKAHFVPGVIPGETVVGRILKDGGSWARAELVEVREAAPTRIEPLCPHAEVCGGCQWQHAEYQSQLNWKRNTVVSQLQHIGKIAEPPVHDIIAAGPAFAYRNRMDFKVRQGKPAMHRARSHDLVPLDVCELLDPRLRTIFDSLGDLAEVDRITLRCGTNTGDALVIVDGLLPEQAGDWGAALAVQQGKSVEGVDGAARIREEILGHRYRITGNAFFQNNSYGAAALVELVEAVLEPTERDTLLDAYAGVGLFGVALGSKVDRVIAVESNKTAIDDLRRNLSDANVDHRVIRGKMERVAADLDEYPDLAVVDPPRTGLGEIGVAAVTAGDPYKLAYVSCDPASLARDTLLLAEYGYQLQDVTPVDLFPQTFHIEAVASFHLA
ncbi:MAG: class I SAM-dependent RNA methyltransferase [Acidimicrobiia bacterium]|nr:class I SAM-dependent RNA methyltransferase [Acidimicrobiia bacterium]